MPKPRKGGGGGWGIQSVVNGWINVNEHQLAPADIHELQQVQQPTSATGGGGDGGGNRPLHPPGASAIAAAAAATTAAGNTTGASSQSVSAGRQNQHQRQQQRSRYSEPGTYSHGHGHGHGHSSHGGLYPPGGPVPGDGRVILGRRESAEPDRPGSSSKWGPEPLPLSPEASPLMMPASGGSGGSQPGPPGGRQPPHLGLDASSSAHSRSSHSHSNLSSSRGGGSSSAGGGGSRGLSLVASSYGKSHSHGYSLSSSYRGGSMLPGGGGGGPTGGMAASSTSFSTTGGFHVGDRKSSMKTHITSATEGEMTLSDGHQSSNFSDRSGTSMSLLSSPYRRDSGQQYDGPAAPASVGNVLGGSGGGIGAALGMASSTESAIPTAAAAAKGEELTSTAPSTAAMTHHDNIMALNSTNFASAARTAGYGKRRSSTAYQSSELDYSTSAAGGSMQFGTSPYLNSRRASALTELTASTIPSRRDSASPPEEEEEGEQYHRYYRSSSGSGGDGSASMRSTKSSSASTVGSSTSRATTKSRKKERNALRRTNSQSDILKVMAGGGVGQTHLSLEEKSRRKSDAFLRKVHEMQVQQRQKLIAVQEAEELRMHHLEGDNPSQQPQLHQYPSATGRSDRSLSVSGSGTSGSVTVTHSNTALSVNTKGTESSDNAQVQILAGTMEAPPQIHRRTSASTKGDDASEDNSIQKFVSGILGMGASDEKGKQPQQQEQRSTSSAKQQPLPQPQQQQQIQQQIQQQKQLLHQVQLQQQQQQRGPTNTGQYLNEAAFVQHVERQRAAAMAMQQQQQKQSSSSVAGSSSGRSKKSSKGDSRRRSDDGLPLNTVSAIPSSARENQRALYPGQQPPLHPPQQQQGFGGQSTHQHPLGSGTTGRGGYVVTGPGVVQPIAPRSPSQHHGHGADSKSCAQCTILEKQLIALQADLDYLRSIITQNEFICADCEAPSSSKGSSKRRSSSAAVPSSGASVSSTKSKKSISTSASRKGKKSKFGSSAQLSQLSGDTDKPHESDALNDASQRLMAVASRHKRQIEQMTKETARWQNDMHLKLSKMSMMCKDLNDESAKRKEEATNIQATLARVRADRNALESEVESLRARIALYEKEDVENDRVSRALDDKETTDLDRMDTAIEDRDGALTNMSSQLDRALTSLEAERKEQMESHSARKKSMSFNPTSANETSFFNPLLGIARAARVDEGRAENDEVAETTRKEDELQKRCKALEKELEAAQERLRKSAANA